MQREYVEGCGEREKLTQQLEGVREEEGEERGWREGRWEESGRGHVLVAFVFNFDRLRSVLFLVPFHCVIYILYCELRQCPLSPSYHLPLLCLSSFLTLTLISSLQSRPSLSPPSSLSPSLPPCSPTLPPSRITGSGCQSRRQLCSMRWVWQGWTGGGSFWQRARQVWRRLWPRHSKCGMKGQHCTIHCCREVV